MGWKEQLLGRKANAAGERIEGLLRELSRRDTPEGRTLLHRALLDGKLLLATPGEAGRQGSAGGGAGRERLRFIAGRDPAGTRGMLAFPGGGGLRGWRPVGCDFRELDAREVFRLARANQLTWVLNPRGPAGGFLRRHEVAALAD